VSLRHLIHNLARIESALELIAKLVPEAGVARESEQEVLCVLRECRKDIQEEMREYGAEHTASAP
jgi:hypothetical protein